MEHPTNKPENITNSPELHLEEQDRIMVIGAGGFTANQLYLRNFANMGVSPEQLVLVDTDADRLSQAEGDYPGAATYSDVDQALDTEAEQDNNVRAIFIASSTAAHADNIQSIISASEAGRLDLSRTKVWCEKPVTPTEVFDEIRALASEHPDFDLSVGYILRFSETLTALNTYIEENNLKVTGLEWIYGKDRTKDTRPTQGVFPDEVVHPLSVTDLVLSRAFGDAIGVDVEFAEIQNRPFADPEVQEKARATNPSVPERPTSDVYSELEYSFNKDGTVTKIPVTIASSFLMDGQMRQVNVSVSGPEGEDVLTVDFDANETNPDGTKKRVDTLHKQDGTRLFESGLDKSRAQIAGFLNLGEAGHLADAPTSLEGEDRIQNILGSIGRVAMGLSLSEKMNALTTSPVESFQVVPGQIDETIDELLESLGGAAKEEYTVTDVIPFSGELEPISALDDDELTAVVITKGTGTANFVTDKKHATSIKVEPGSVILVKADRDIEDTPWLQMRTAVGGEGLEGRFVMRRHTQAYLGHDLEVMIDAGAKARRSQGEHLQKIASGKKKILQKAGV